MSCCHTQDGCTQHDSVKKTRPKRIHNIIPFIENPRLCKKMFSDRKTDQWLLRMGQEQGGAGGSDHQ